MHITEQAFASTVTYYVESLGKPLVLTRHESEVPDLWSYRTEGPAVPGTLRNRPHGLFEQVYNRAIIVPEAWSRFSEQFYSPEARLLMHFYRECQQPSWLTWDPADTSRDDAPMTEHFVTQTHQNRTYTALREQLRMRGLVTKPTRRYADDADAFGVELPDRVVDFPGSYSALMSVMMELESDVRHTGDFPRDLKLYGESRPVLHMIGNTVESVDSELARLVAQNSRPEPKRQQVVYVFSELRNGKLIARNIGHMMVSVLEIAYGSLTGAIHYDRNYLVLVPGDLSPDEVKLLGVSSSNWEGHQAAIIAGCPGVAGILAQPTLHKS